MREEGSDIGVMRAWVSCLRVFHFLTAIPDRLNQKQAYIAKGVLPNSRKTAQRIVQRSYKVNKEILKKKLRDAVSDVHLALDCWSCRPGVDHYHIKLTASLQFRWLAQPLPHGLFEGEI